jgi:putative membrane-bound dehydrogenase-like protein
MKRGAIVIALMLPLTAMAQTPKVPEGFQVELILQAPDIEAPTALTVAPNGDVYFAEDPMDMSGPPTKNIDKIWMLKGGDPKKKILIAEQMWAVMGLEVVRDKLYCVHPPFVTVFTLDADGKASKREDLFTDLGPPVAGAPSFNDHVPSGIRMGMDGWLYVSIGDKGIPKMTRKEKDQGSVLVAEGRWRHTKEGNHISLEGGGVIRFRPDGSGLEVFASGTRNHLDVPMDEHDRIFVRDNTDDGLGWNTRLMYLPPGAFMGYPWAYKQRPKECLPAITEFGGGSPCGGWVYTDDGLPEDYRGRIFHCEWGQGKIGAVKVKPDGAGFKFVDQIDFMTPNGVKDFRPFTLRPTADGRGFYVTDWGHSGWLAKVKAGRLWKVTYTKDDVKPKPRGKDTDLVDELIGLLGHPAHRERVRAQRELVAKGDDAGRAVLDRARRELLEVQAIRHALWIVTATKVPGAWDLVLKSVKGGDAGVRLEAARVLEDFPATTPKQETEAVCKQLADRLAEEADAQVRLHLVTALGRLPTAITRQDLFGRLYNEKDPWAFHATMHAFKRIGDRLLDVPVTRGDLDCPEPVTRALADNFQLETIRLLDRLDTPDFAEVRKRIVETLSRNYFDRKPYSGTWWGTQPAGQKPPARNVPWEGTPAVREAILKALGDKDAGVRKAAVAALVTANDAVTFEPLIKQFETEKDPETKADIIRAISGLGKGDTTFLTSVLNDTNNTQPIRLEAIAGLEKVNSPAAQEVFSKIALSKEADPLRVRAVEALGVTKAKAARDVCMKILKGDETDNLRRAAVVTLAQLGDQSVAELLLPLLGDKEELTVKTSAIKALGTLKAKTAVPALIRVAGVEATQFDAITALTQMPDARAVSAYLTGLTSKNQSLRQSSKQALIAIREEIVPTLEQLAKGHEIPATALAELRTIYSSFAPITAWKLIGPFPRDGKVHPPETEQKFDVLYKGAGKEVKWQDVSADAKTGRVNLEAKLDPNQQMEAFAFTELESSMARDAVMACGSDDTITVWLNGKKVHEHNGDRAWTAEQDKFNVKLEKGKNRLLIKCGNSGGPWDFSVAVSGETDRYAFLQGGGKKFDLESFRDFARKNKGDAARGQKLFADVKGLACIKCHAVGGEGGQVGPSLDGIALRYQKEDLMTSILEPSKLIANGYDTVILVTTAGKQITGVFKGETGDAVTLADAEGKTVSVAKKDIDERKTSPVSTMPNGLNDGMTLQDFADIIAFLEARREMPPKP